MNQVIYIKDINQWNTIIQEHENKNNILVVCFGGTWCGPCNSLAPKFTSLAETYDNHILFLKIDIDECTLIADKFNISSVPTTLIIKKSNIVKTIVGADYIGIKVGIDNQLNLLSSYQ